MEFSSEQVVGHNLSKIKVERGRDGNNTISPFLIIEVGVGEDGEEDPGNSLDELIGIKEELDGIKVPFIVCRAGINIRLSNEFL